MGIDGIFCSREQDADSSPQPPVAKAEVRLMTCQSDGQVINLFRQ